MIDYSNILILIGLGSSQESRNFFWLHHHVIAIVAMVMMRSMKFDEIAVIALMIRRFYPVIRPIG